MISKDSDRFERHVLLLMALVQFINIWDFMIVMPLGPDWARSLGLDIGKIGLIAGSYSIAAAFIGVASASFLDRFDRRNVLLFNLTGLMFSTAAMVLAHTAVQLSIVRVITGLFGGTTIASSLAVISDVFPPQRRGEAMGKVFGSFSVASVLGVPLGLEMARHFGWWSPFALISCMALLTIIAIYRLLPPIRYHLDNPHPNAPPLFASLRHNAAALPAALMTATGLFASFLIIPNVSAHAQQNLDYPRAHLGLLYFLGGGAAFFSMRWVGKKSDKFGYGKTTMIATLILIGVLYVGFYLQLREVSILLIFVLFMLCMSTRNVTANALISRIPAPHERAGFMALMSSIQSLFAGVGAFFSTLMLSETPEGKLAGMQNVSLLSMGSFLVSALIMLRIEKILRRREAKPH